MTFIVVYSRANYTDYKQQNCNYYEQFDVHNYKFDRAEIRALLDNEVGTKAYLLFDNKLNGDNFTILQTRTIVIGDLEGYDYIQGLCHELVHLKFCTANETYTQFMTFKILYESENEILHDCGCDFANAQFKHLWFGDYDCAYYIEQYLKGVR